MNKRHLQTKRILLSVLIVLLLNVVGLTKMYAYSFSAVCSTGQTLYYNIIDSDNHYVELTYPGNSTNFNYWTGFTKPDGNIILSDSVQYNGVIYTLTMIGNSAFFGCYGLTSIEIPNAVTSIGHSAFYFCSGLTSIEIPNSVTSIGSSAFSSCSSLEQIIVASGNTVYDSRDNCNAIIETSTNKLVTGCKNTVIANSVTSIGNDAFFDCSGLASIEIPNSVTSIGSSAFYGCYGLTSIEIPNSVTSIGGWAFYYCSRLTSVEIPNSVTSIEDRTFYHCSRLTSIEIPNSVTSIDRSAFEYCSGLASVIVLADNPPTLGSDAFYNVNKSIPVYVPCGNVEAYTVVNWGGFSNFNGLCGGEITVTANPAEGGTVTGGGTFGADETCTVTATANEGYAFANWTQDGTIVSADAEYTFYVSGDMNLVAHFVPNANITFADANVKGICVERWDTNGDGELSYAEAAAVTNLGSVFYSNSNISSFDELQYFVRLTSIGDNAFSYCSGLASIEIPNSVTSIGDNAFYNCNGLTSIEIPNSVTSIGNYAFSYCSGLASIEIPNSVTSIGNSVFFSCSGLASIQIPNSVTSIGDNAFYNCNGLTSIEIPNSVTSIGDNAFYNCNGLTSIEIPNSVTSIGNSAFSYCSGLASIEIPNSVTSIGDNAFYNCNGLASIEIPNSVTSIGNSVFFSCSGLASIEIPNSVTSIGDNAFYNCNGLTSIEIPNSVISIGNSAFSYCSGLASIEIPNSVTSIGNYAFSYCSGLASIEIPNSVTSIDYCAFYYCSSLCSIIVLAETPPTIVQNVFSGVPTITPVYVPCGSIASYQNASGWKRFSNILGMCSSGTITVGSTQGGIVTGTGTYECGTSCTVTATANEGYTFMYWTENDVVVSTQSEYTFVVPTDRNLVAHFALPFNVTIVANPPEGGTINGELDEYNYGSVCIVSATPNENYTIMYWTMDGTQVSSNTSFAFVVTSDCEVEAHFSLPLSVTTTANLTGAGMITGSGEYDYGSTCTLTATPNEGYLFLNWSVNGEVVSCYHSYSFTVTEDIHLEAVFMYFDGNLIGEGEMTSSCLPSVSYYNNSLSQQIYTYSEIGAVYGSITSISFFYDPGWGGGETPGPWGPWWPEEPDPWLKVGRDNTRSYDIYLVHTDKTVFNDNTDWIPVTEADRVFSGSVTMACGYWTTIFFDTPFAYDSIYNLAIIVVDNTGETTYDLSYRVFNTPNRQSIFYSSNYETPNPYNPSAYNGTLLSMKNQIVFNMSSYYISAYSNSEGGFVNGSGWYASGSTCTLTATANEGYAFTNWTENGEVVSTEAEYTFTVTGDRTLVANFGEITNFWTPNVEDYEDNMTFTCVVEIDGEEQRSTMLEVGAFCGEECRGSQRATYFAPTDRYIIQMTVFGEGNDVISFRLFDHQQQAELPLNPPAGVAFSNNGYGSLSTPYVLNFTSSVTHTQPLNNGWNWWSTYVELNNNDGLSQLENSIGSNGLVIKSRTNGYVEAYDDNGVTIWYGTLNSINNEQMYKIRTNAACEATVVGVPAVPENHPISINSGWNWIGFPCNQDVSVDVAMSDFTPENNDVIKGRTGFTTYYSDNNYNMWYGTLNTLEVGKGYMYRSNSTTQKTLVFQTGRGETTMENVTTEDNIFQPADGDFADNMTLTAVVEMDGEELRSEDYELAAFVGDECRGSVRLMYVEPIDRYIAFLTIFGEQDEELYFQLTDGIAGSLASDQMAFAADGIVGTLDNPFVMHFGTLDVDESASANVKVYPNPSEGIFNIEGQNIRKVEVFNAFGQSVYSEETRNGFMKLDLTNRAAGIYLIRIVTNEGILNHQIIKK